MSKGYWAGAHTRHRLRYHLVWTPKYCRRVMRGKIANRIRGLFYKACEINGWWIHEVAINPDHVHIFIQINPTDTLSRVVQQLKGGSSIVIRKEFPGLEEFLWGDSFWADGYFAETSGKISEKRIIQYIIEQNKSMPH